MTLFDTVSAITTSTALVPVRPCCHVCGAAIFTITVHEPALLRGCDYGATRATTFAVCNMPACRAVRVSAVAALNPRKVTA